MNVSKIFKEKKLDFLIIRSGDEFLSEIAEVQKNTIYKFTGFSGSNGIAILEKKNKNILFTDSRYKIQAKNECQNYEILDISEFFNYLKNIKGQIGFDPSFHSLNEAQKMLNINKNLNFIEIELSSKEKKITPNILKVEEEICGESPNSKLKKIREKLVELKSDGIFISNPQDTSWIFNIRDLNNKFSYIYNSYAFVTQNEVVLLKDFSDLENYVKLKDKNFSISIYREINYKNYNLLRNHFNNLNVGTNFIEKMRMIKTKIEISGMKKAQELDSISLSKFLKEKSFFLGKSEYEISEKINELRSINKSFIGESFETICGFNENGAIVHYRPEKSNSKIINGNGLLLIDSGGQYYGNKAYGTTDITRTISIGKPNKEQKNNFTLVLKGHIAVATAIFKKGTTGAQIDILARQFLWKSGLDYGHGTGHGVGCFLSVHEGDCNISPRGNVQLEEGMILSNEPGFYKENEYGIRIENLILVKKSNHVDFLEFETITKVPIDEDLIEFEILSENELKWIKEYNKESNLYI